MTEEFDHRRVSSVCLSVCVGRTVQRTTTNDERILKGNRIASALPSVERAVQRTKTNDQRASYHRGYRQRHMTDDSCRKRYRYLFVCARKGVQRTKPSNWKTHRCTHGKRWRFRRGSPSIWTVAMPTAQLAFIDLSNFRLVLALWPAGLRWSVTHRDTPTIPTEFNPILCEFDA